MTQADIQMIKETLAGLLDWIKATTERMDHFSVKLTELEGRIKTIENAGK